MNITAFNFRKFLFQVIALAIVVGLVLAAPVTPAYAAASGPNFPGTGTDVAGVGTIAWANPGNVTSDNNVNATATTNGVTHYLQATNYGFAIPAAATITGITVIIGRYGTTGAGNDVRDNVVSLIKGGVVVTGAGSNLAATGTDWPAAEAAATYGGTTNLWGTTWTPANINAANFGVALSVTTNGRTANVDYIQVTVTYTLPPTTTTLASSLNPSNQGDSVNLTATVSSAIAGTITGPVNFFDGATNIGTVTLTLVGGQYQAILTTSALLTGNHSITAVYGGDNNYAGSTSTAVNQVVYGPPNITNVNNPTFVVGTNGPAFTVTATGNPAPTFSIVETLPNGLTFNGTTGVLTGTPAAGTAGVYTLHVTATNSAGTDTHTFTLTINQAPAFTSANTTTFTVGTAGSFTITTSGRPNATVTITGGALPNGVTLVNNGDGTATLSGTPAVGTGGQRTLTFTANNGVNPNATQTFTLNINEAPAITSANTVTFSVGTNGTFTATATGYPAPTWSTVTGLPTGITFNTTTHVLSGTAAAGTVGSYPITFTVTNAAGTANQNFALVVQKGNQTITFAQPPTPAGFGTTYTIAPTASSGLPVTVTAAGSCTIAGYVVTYNAQGACTLTASQAGNASYNAALNVVRTVQVQPAATDTTITSSVNPSVLGQNVIFTVRVTAGGVPVTSGTVTITSCQWIVLFCAPGTNQTWGTYTLVGGVVTINKADLPVARYGGNIVPSRITATYNGSGNYNGSNETLDQTVNTANTAVALTSSINPSYFGQAVTFTATVTVLAPGAGQVQGGTVTFYEGATTLGSGTVNASGQVSVTLSNLARGSHNVTAYFQGTDDFGTSTSPVLVQIVRRETDIALTSAPNPSVYGGTVTFTATVTDPASAGTPSGTVSFYDGAVLPANLLGTSTLSGAAVATFNTSQLSAGSHNIIAVYNGDNFYVAVTSTALVQVVNPAELTVTADDKSITYGDANPPFTYTFGGFANGQTPATSDVTGTADCSTSATTTSPVGTYPITCTTGSLNSNNYTFNFVDGTLTITQKALTITADNQGKTYGFTLTFNGTEFTSSGLINGDTVTSVTLTSAGAAAGAANGTYDIIPSAAVGTGLGNYAITYVNGKLTVGGNLLIITANDYVGANAKNYGTTLTLPSTAFTYYLAGGGNLQPGESLTGVTLTSLGTAANAPVGTYQIVPSNAVGTGLTNYVIIYRNGQLDVNPIPLTFDPGSHTKIYGDTFTGYTGAFTGLMPFDNTITPVYDSPGAPAAATVTAPGPVYPINVSFNDPDGRLSNYILTVDPAPAATLTILPRPLTVTPTNRSKIYGDILTSADFTGTITGIQNGDNITATYDSPTGDPATAVVGTYNIVATIADPDRTLGNYTLTNNVGILTVTQRNLVVTSNNQSKFYGDVFSAFTGSVTGLQNGDVITPTYASTGAPALATVGVYNITVTPLVDPGNKLANYNVTYNIGTLSVLRRDLVFTPDNKTKVYGDTFTAFTGTVTGLQNGDNITPNYSSPGAISTATVAGSPYPITITLSDPGNKLGNYNYTINTGTLTVTKRPLIVTPDDKSKVYGTWFLAFTGTISGIQNNDNITANYASAGSAPTANVGTYPITATLNDPTGKLDNYDVTLNTGTLTVTASVLTVRADNKTIFYGDPDPAFTFIYSGFQGTDTPAVIDTAPTCTVTGAHTNVGTYPIICSGGVDNNYSFSYPGGSTLTVTKRNLIVTPADKIKLYGSVFNAFTGTIAGIQYGDNITASYASLGAPANASVGTYDITATLNDPDGKLANYTVTLGTGTLNVVSRTLVVSPDNQSKIYGDTFTAYTATINGLQNGETITVNYTSAGAGPTATVGNYPITITLSDPGNILSNYDVTLNTATLAVTRRPLIVTPDDKAKVFGTNFTAFTGTVVGLQNGDNITPNYASTGAPAAAAAGIYPITVTLSDPNNRLPNYIVTLNQGTLTVGVNVLTVTADNKTIVYGDPDPGFTFTYTGFQGTDTPAVIDTPPTCVVSATHNAVGTYPITCSGGADNNYIFTYIPGTLTVTRRALVVAPDNKTKVYGDTFTAFTGTVTGLQAGDNITVNYSSTGAAGTASIGTYPIVATLVDPNNRLGNYTVTLNTGQLTVTQRALTVTPDNKNKVYGTAFTAFTGSIVGLQGGDSITVTYNSAGSAATAVVGAYPITATLADPGNILANYAITLNTGTLTVTQRDLVVTPADKTKVYGDVFSAFTGAIVGIQNGDAITATYASTGAVATAAIGTYPITVTLNALPAVLANYNITYNTGTLTVTPRALIVTPDDKGKPFGTTFTAFTGTIVGLQAGDNITANYASAGAGAAAAVGTYPITVTLTDPGNRLPNYTVTLHTGTLTVGNTVLTVTANNQTMVYGDPDPAFTFTYAGFQGGDTPAVLITQPTCQAATHNAIGTFPITCSGGLDENYVFSYTPGTLTVTPRALVVTPANKTKVYGDIFTAFTGTFTGAIGSDSITVTYDSNGAPAAAIVGTYPITATLDDPFGRLGNYTVTLNTGTLTVNRRTLIVTPDDKNKVYGTLFTAFTGTVSGIQNGDNIYPTYASTGSATTAAAGTYPITATLNDPGNKLTNYAVTYNTGTLTVTGNTLIVTPADKVKTYGDLFTAFTGTVVGVQPGDNITATYASPGAAANATVGTYNITVTLNDPLNRLGNYSNIILNTGTLTVTPRALVVTPDNKTKVFGATFTAFTGTVTGVQTGDNITATYASAGAPPAAAAGTYAITATLNDPGNRLSNYTVTLNTGTLTVGLNLLTVTADNKTMVYGDPDPAFTFTYAGFQGTDTPAVLTTQPTCQAATHNAIGTFPITCSGGLDDNYSFAYIAGTLTVTSRPLTVTPNNQTKIYGDIFTAFTGTVTGMQASDNITVVYSSTGSPAATTVGTYPIIATLNDPNNRLANYTVTLNTGTLTVTRRILLVTPDDKSKVYGTVFTGFTGNIVGIQNGDVITATYASNGAAAAAAVGTYPITATLNDPGNKLPNYTVTLNTGTLTVTQHDLVITPADKTKVYGDVFTAFTGTITGTQNGDAVTATYTSPGAAATATVAGSPYAINATANGTPAVLANYNIILNTGSLTVTSRTLTVTPDNKAKLFGTTFTAFTGTVTGLQAGDNITVTYASAGAPAAAAVGTYPITAALNDPGGRLPNYTVTLNQGTLTVALSVLTVTANNQSKVYGALDPAFTFTYAGFVGTDTPAVLDTPPTCQAVNPHVNVGTYAITCAGGVDDNYAFTYVPGTLTITPRALNVTPDNKTKVYGDTFTAFTGVLNGLQAGDNVTATYASAGAPAAAAIGNYPITATLNDPNGRLANYTVTLNTGTLSVTTRALLVTPTDQNKVYGNAFTAFTGTITGIQNGDAITATYNSTGAAATAAVGTYPITATVNAPAGILANYAVTSNAGTLIVTQRDLTVTPADKTKVYGTLFNAFTGSLAGIQNGDPITANYSSLGAPVAATVGDYPITATLNDPNGRLANYNVTLNQGTLSVTLATATVAVTSSNNPAGVSDPITFTTTVTSPYGTPTGTVTFFNNGNSLGTVALTNGEATLTTSTLTAGSHTITVTYNGDANFGTSTSAPYVQGVGQTLTTTVVTSDTNPSNLGQSVTFTAIASSTLGTPTGTVTFMDGAITLGTGTLTAGRATFSATTLLTGTHNITASYGGDPDYFGSTSAVLVQVVIPDTFIDKTPPNPDNSLNPVFTFSSTSPTAIFACRIDGKAFSPCSSGDTFGPLTAGPHTFDVRSVDSFGNVDATPATYSWTIDSSAPDTKIDSMPPAATNIKSGTFTFSSPATDLVGFECQLDGGGFSACTTPHDVTELSPGQHTFDVRAYDTAGNRDPSPASYTWTVDLGYPVVLFNANTVPGNNATTNGGPTRMKVAFSKDVKNDSSAGAANNPANYLLLDDGVNDTFDTTSCAIGPAADDISIPIAIPTYSNEGGAGPFVATFTINGGVPLPIGTYRLLVCGTTSVEDLAGNKLNNGVNDTTITFTVNPYSGGGGGNGGHGNGKGTGTATTSGLFIPVTGFAKGKVTELPVQPANMMYAATDLWIEIPKLGIKTPIVGVPKTDKGWDISWLGADVGWLNGSAFPTWDGNSVLTAHIWNANNTAGPFDGLVNLQYGDRIKIHAYGQVYTYAVVDSSLILPSDIKTAFQHKEDSWLTLITCEGYQQKTGTYSNRRMIRAMLVSTEKEK
jgi:LPXTG-site transpeptidase (sortase) family protein